MTALARRVQDKTNTDVLELLVAEGFEGMAEAMSITLRKSTQAGTGRDACARGFNPQQNAQRYVPHHSMKKSMAADIRSIFNAPDEHEAKQLLIHFSERKLQKNR